MPHQIECVRSYAFTETPYLIPRTNKFIKLQAAPLARS